MKRAFAVSILVLGLGACSNLDKAPSHLGFNAARASETSEEPEMKPAAALRRVKSNKVLGAMAFTKVTGRPIDPARLSGE